MAIAAASAIPDRGEDGDDDNDGLLSFVLVKLQLMISSLSPLLLLLLLLFRATA